MDEVTAGRKRSTRKWVSDAVQRTLGGLGSVFLFLMGVAATIQIVSRLIPPEYVPISTGWTTESIRYLMVFMTAVGVPYAMRSGSHVSVRPLIRKLSSTWFRRLIVFSNLAIVLMSGMVVVSGITVAERTIDQSLRTLGWLKVGYGHLFLSAMFVITIAYAIGQIYDIVTDSESFTSSTESQNTDGVERSNDG